MKRLAALAAVLACLLPAAASGWTKHDALDSAASWLAQRPVYVKCLSKWETSRDNSIIVFGAVAYVVILDGDKPDDHTTVAWPWCEPILHPDQFTMADFATAVLILTHESFHLRGGPGWLDERRTNCWAARRASAVAVLRFGLPLDQRAEFDREMWKVYRSQPYPYKNSACLPR